MELYDSAIILIGFQNDYFADDGILRAVIDEPAHTLNTLIVALS